MQAEQDILIGGKEFQDQAKKFRDTLWFHNIIL